MDLPWVLSEPEASTEPDTPLVPDEKDDLGENEAGKDGAEDDEGSGDEEERRRLLEDFDLLSQPSSWRLLSFRLMAVCGTATAIALAAVHNQRRRRDAKAQCNGAMPRVIEGS